MSIRLIAKDHRVDEIGDERDQGQGVWAYLKTGYHWDNCHAVHESTPARVLAQLKRVEKCDCGDCTRTLK